MIVLVLTAVPEGLRGHLTRWLMEISAGVFVGRLPARTRDFVWARTVEMLHQGRAVMVYSARNEQGLEFRVHGHHWQPVDFEGIQLILRPASTDSQPAPARSGWSKASKQRRYGRRGLTMPNSQDLG